MAPNVFSSSYLSPEALHSVWFQLDEPLVVNFEGDAQLAHDFAQKVLYASEVLANTIGVKVLLLKVDSKEEPNLVADWNINRYPTLLIYDGREVVRLSEDLEREALVEWIKVNLEEARLQ